MNRKILIAACTFLFALGCGTGEESASFKWDLNGGASYSYALAQDGLVTVIGNDNDSTFTRIKVDAQIDVSALDTNNAYLNMHQMVFTMIALDSLRQGRDTVINPMPSLDLSGMNARGGFDTDDGQIFFGLLFPLPSKDLTQGMTDTLDVTIPVNVGMYAMSIVGKKTMHFKGYEEIEGKKYGVLESALISSELEVPENAEGSFSYQEQTKGTHYFDLEEGAYFRSEIEVERSNSVTLYDSISATTTNVFSYTLERK